MFTLYGYPKTRSSRVLWAFEELGAEYEIIPTAPGVQAKSDSYLKLNPAGKVPCLVHDDLVLTESAAICTYLADLFPEKSFIPTINTTDRAQYNSWCYFAMTELEQPIWSMIKHAYALPKLYRIRQMRKTAEYEFQRALDVFQQNLGEKSFLVGDHFSMADLIVTSILLWRNNMKIDRPLGYDNVEVYFELHKDRPALQRTLIREEELKASLKTT